MPSPQQAPGGFTPLAVLFPWMNLGRGVPVVLHAYFDDSATLPREQKGLIALAGYIADDRGWADFCREWHTILTRHHLRRLHTSDFLSGEGEYRSPSIPLAKRLEILREFILAVRRHVISAVAVGVDPKAYRAVMAAVHKKFSPIEFCCYRVIKATVATVREWDARALPLVMAFDQSPESLSFHSHFLELKKKREEVRDAIAAFSFADDRWFEPVQAADMLACLATREFRKEEHQAWRESPFRELFLSADEPPLPIPAVSEWWGEEQLRVGLEGATEPF